ncbi:MAG: penicillin-binding protein activator LpoB [bacterium]|nr:penicillin-binding protein activator LpoB [bacterium]
MKKLICLSILMMFFVLNCAARQVQRIDEGQQVDLSGRWNDTDSKLVAQEMIKDGLARNWLTDFIQENGKKPAVIVGIIKNKTHELISTETFIKDIEREFINSGKVKVVQAGDERKKLRDERADQQEYASSETAKQWGKEKGADFMLQGAVNSIVDTIRNKKVVFYQVDMELSHIESNEKVWLGTKKIKKFIKN